MVQHFAAMLPQMGKPQEDGLRIVREIRDRTGVLVERRPGAFAFSHLTFQEYLTALDYASRSEQLLEYLDDPWWHEVIALAVGIPGCDPVRIISALLRKEEDRDAVILAAKCLETAIHIPRDLRKEVEDALEGILPSAVVSHIDQLSEIGLTVAPILARVLFNFDASRKTFALLFLSNSNTNQSFPFLYNWPERQSRA